MAPGRNPYQGTHRKIVIALDVGTTNSGISYCVLEPGVVPEIRSVTRYPAQEQMGQDTKIPSCVLYDREGVARAFGAETLREEIQHEAEANSWTLAEWFKLYLPTGNLTKLREMEPERAQNLPRIPPHKAAVEIFVDFVRYLYRWVKQYICEVNGDDHWWDMIGNNIEFVLTHPNGWEGAEQAKLRNIVVRAGLVPNTAEGQARVHFVTEGEACLHHCIHELASSHPDLQSMKHVMIIDAGGGTIDLSTYTTRRGAKLSPTACFEEIAVPQTRLAGSVFVTKAFERHVRRTLPDNYQDDIERMVNEFDKKTKVRFRDDLHDRTFVWFGTFREHDPQLGIEHGKLMLSSDDMKKFFAHSVNSIIATADEQIRAAFQDFNKPLEVAFLVGGFATNDWLYSHLKRYLERQGVVLLRPETYVNKATANGAIAFYLDQFVSVRISRYTYGTEFERLYDPRDREHRKRKHTRYRALSGELFLPSGFCTVLAKSVRVQESETYTVSLDREAKTREDLRTVPVEIIVYRGQQEDPQWMDSEPDKFRVLAKIVADTSMLAESLRPRRSPHSRCRYFQVEFEVALIFGLTELKAEVRWRENGRMKRTPAQIIYDT